MQIATEMTQNIKNISTLFNHCLTNEHPALLFKTTQFLCEVVV